MIEQIPLNIKYFNNNFQFIIFIKSMIRCDQQRVLCYKTPLLALCAILNHSHSRMVVQFENVNIVSQLPLNGSHSKLHKVPITANTGSPVAENFA